MLTGLPNQKHAQTDRSIMTARQYLLSQAEHCRRVAAGTSDPFIVEELQRLASDFERRARAGGHFRPQAPEAPSPGARPVVPAAIEIAAQ